MLDTNTTLNEHQILDTMLDMGRRAKSAAGQLAIATTQQKTAALIGMAQAITDHEQQILNANAIDMENAQTAGLATSFMDRLELSSSRIAAMAEGLRAIASLPDPVGKTLAKWTRPNGLEIERVSTPLGVIGVIYESRPNVTADAGALCLMAGNAVILRGGSDSWNSSRAIHDAMIVGLANAGLPQDAVQMVPTTDRRAVGAMLKGLNGTLDVIIPRGGKGLVARVQEEARVPVFAHLEGLCHVYIDKSADPKMAVEISVNSKMRRTGICGAAETLLLDRALSNDVLKQILNGLRDAGCAIRGDKEIADLCDGVEPANEEDWRTEYLDSIITAGMVDGVADAISHINQWSSNHTEAIVAQDSDAVSDFFSKIDSAILLHNASTQFADGGEFGMGAEIGIATGKMHARGPVGVEQLTSFKYIVHGNGQIRP